VEFLINPDVAYLLIVAAVMLFILTAIKPKSTLLKVGMVVCLGAAGYEFSQLCGNVWALLVVAFSPAPFFVAIRQPRPNSLLAIITIAMLTIGSVFLFWTANGQLYIMPLAGLVAIFCGRSIWILFLRLRDTRSTRLSDNPESVIGLIGTVRSAIEKFDTGSIEIEGESWTARSDQPIPVGSMVRVVRFDGLTLTVEKVEKLTKNKNT
jgi:membrane-bound serine protease (ClpP class)